MLQSVPHTLWNKKNAAVHQKLAEGTIKTYYHGAGESYIFKTDTEPCTALFRSRPRVSSGSSST